VKTWFSLLILLIAGSGCAPAGRVSEPDLLKPATIKDIMDSSVDPSGDFLFESVVTISDENGYREVAPETEEEWKEVRRRALALVEAPNLLVMPGREVARPGEKAENPQVELGPEEILKKVDADRSVFIKLARGLQDAAMLAVSATDRKDKEALFQAAEAIDVACERCHLQYWYPNDKIAIETFEKQEQERQQRQQQQEPK
jgi:hypothetical protein